MGVLFRNRLRVLGIILFLVWQIPDMKRQEFEQKIARYKEQDKKRKELLESKVIRYPLRENANIFLLYYDYSVDRIFIHPLIGFVLIFLCSIGSWVAYSIFEIILILIDYLIWEKGFCIKDLKKNFFG